MPELYRLGLAESRGYPVPLILGLVRGGKELEALSDDERRILAKWAGKTAIIESHSVGAECPVISEYLKRMRTSGDVPGRFAVAACRMQLLGFGHMQIGIISDLLGGAKAAGNIIMIALPKLVFACAFPMLETPYECRCVKSLYTPLWPHPTSSRPMDQTAMQSEPDGAETAGILNADGTAEQKPFTHVTVLQNFFDELQRRVPVGEK